MKTRISLLAAAAVLVITTGCEGESPERQVAVKTDLIPPVPLGELVPRNRYKFNHDCVVMKSASTDNFVVSSGAGYAATEPEIENADAFFMMPSSLGEYLIYNADRNLISGTAALPAITGLSTTELDGADSDNGNDNIFVVKTDGDLTNYPVKPVFVPEPYLPRVEPSLAWTTEYHGFEDPNIEDTRFTFVSASTGNAITAGPDGTLTTAAFTGADEQVLIPQSVAPASCQEFPEASSNTIGETFKGTTSEGNVLGLVDGHVHISSTNFLGKAQWGFPFHPFGVTHALSDCEEYHGPGGTSAAVEAAFEEDTDGHETTGWPTFPNWPSRGNLFHEAIYWKWVERAWKGGLRIAVNDLVDNETLCEISRNAASDPTLDCNSMNNAGRQAFTMWAMQDYIDAQYGGRGEGFFQVVLQPDEAREVVEAGKLAVIIGIEISNLADCKVNFSPTRQQEPFEETGEGNGENGYVEACTVENLRATIDRMHGWGVRQVITIHEFDNAFGGNGIFDGFILNLGSRENSGGVPGGALAAPNDPAGQVPTGPPAAPELPTGEFWTTLTCPQDGDTEWPRGPNDTTPAEPFDGWLYGSGGGSEMASAGTCFYAGQGPSDDPTKKRPGGSTPCYEPGKQCNARWLTPLGLSFYSMLMEAGMIFDIDHLAIKMKSQALDLAEKQTPAYPFVSTHGTFGGTTKLQARRMFQNGGLIYPPISSTNGFLRNMADVRQVWEDAGEPGGLFGFSGGTDTNGLSGQTGPRGAGSEPITYPYTLFSGQEWDSIDEFKPLEGVVFEQPSTHDVVTGQGRTWHIDADGNAHYGMMSGNVEEMRIEGTTENILDNFYSAEVYLRMWTQTIASQQSIVGSDGTGRIDVEAIKGDILKQAPVPDEAFTTGAPSM